MIAGIVPANSLKNAKTRLHLPWLLAPHKQEIVLAMLNTVIQAMVDSQLDITYVVSSDPFLLKYSKKLGAKPITEPELLGANDAVSLASRRAIDDGAAATLVLFSDVPLVTKEDIDRLIEKGLKVKGCVVASRSTRGGTNALWRKPAGVIASRYGENSFINHRSEAKDAGVPFFDFDCDRISLDVDTLEDLMLVLRKDRTSKRYEFISRLLKKYDMGGGNYKEE